MYCRNCGSELSEGTNFCEQCGAPVDQASVKQGEDVAEEEAQESSRGEKAGPWRKVSVAVFAVALIALVVALLSRYPVWPTGIALDETTFSDEVLRGQIAQAADLDGDGMLSDEELSSVRSLRVSGVRSVTGLEVFPALEELVVEGDQLEELTIQDMTVLETLVVEDVPNLQGVSIVNAPKLKDVTIDDAPSLSAASFEQTDSLEKVDVPDRTKLTGDVDRLLVDYYVVRSFVKTTVMSSENLESTDSITAAYDEAGRLTSLARELSTNAAYSDPYANPFSAQLSYSEDGCLQRVDVEDPGFYAGTWQITYSDDLRNVSYAFMPDPSNYSQSTDHRMDIFSEDGALLRRTFAFRTDGGYAWGEMLPEYDESGQPLSLTGTYNQVQGRDGSYETSIEYDSRGRIIGCAEGTPEITYKRDCSFNYDSQSNLESSTDRILVLYEYDEKGFLTHATSGDTVADFMTDEDGRITAATIRYAGDSTTTYTVEYETFRLLPGRHLTSAVDFTYPMNPTYAGMPWCDGWWSAKDLLRMNREWLAEHPEEGQATTQGAAGVTAEP